MMSETLETRNALIHEVERGWGGALWSSGGLWEKGEMSFPTRGRAPASLTLMVTQGTAAQRPSHALFLRALSCICLWPRKP